MSARSSFVRIAAKAGMLLGTLFLVTVLLAAIPAHQPPTVEDSAQEPPASAPGLDRGRMPGMDISDEHASENAAVEDLPAGHHHAFHRHRTMTATRERTPEDTERAKEVVAQLGAGIEKYRDDRVALNDGFRIFLPNIPQPEYHFTSCRNGFWEAPTLDPARPPSLLYRKTSNGYELVGAMYTMPERATEEQLNARVPLSVAMWHRHTNWCMPARAPLRNADWTKFGFQGSTLTPDASDAAGRKFTASIFGWMVHVYPYEDSPGKVFAMHHRMDCVPAPSEVSVKIRRTARIGSTLSTPQP